MLRKGPIEQKIFLFHILFSSGGRYFKQNLKGGDHDQREVRGGREGVKWKVYALDRGDRCFLLLIWPPFLKTTY